ncbi:hypothetical protein DFS34DRAFT_154759 [Phlyctochytrium arcticum]|nr:hypothetical protein DFS34DRAFT_154759 [Phlyctochytrium arcticum]
MTAIEVPKTELPGSLNTPGSIRSVSPEPSTPTVLRIKRKRNADPVEALVLAQAESRRQDKKARVNGDGTRIFTLVDTVETKDFEDTGKIKMTLDRLRETKSNRQSIKTMGQRAMTPENRREDVIENKRAESKAARYKVLRNNRQATTDALPYNMLDVAEEDDEDESQRMRRKYGLGRSTGEVNPMSDDDVMKTLMPMVRDYLRVSEGTSANEDDEFVWDIYCPADGAKLLPSARVAQLTWDHDDDIYMHDDEEDSDVPDEADEDSNAEDWYANEYPEASDPELSDGEYYGGIGGQSSDDND